MELLTTREVLKYLKISRSSLYKSLKTDLTFPPTIRIGNLLRFDKKDIDKVSGKE